MGVGTLDDDDEKCRVQASTLALGSTSSGSSEWEEEDGRNGTEYFIIGA